MLVIKNGIHRMDLIGQILHIGYGIKIEEKTRTPACQDTILSPFSRKIRGIATNTDLTYSLISLENYKGPQQIREANRLLAPYSIVLEPFE